ncbi:hypothetical protein V5O48_013500 [Marasmius crinis-equi]|uniref:Uncharacterized protein n=1 Tax=Marasmius crinis-equi TaxID=585013 RepID=A0ABR3EZW8_9AGAR
MLVMYIFHLTLWILDLVNLVTETRIALIDNPELDMKTKYDLAKQAVIRRAAVIDALYSYMTILGDIVIIWRVYAFWALGNWRLALVAPVVLLLGSTITSFLLTFCVARLGGEVLLGSFRSPAFCRGIQTASYVTPAATTLISTILIGVKAWIDSNEGVIRRVGASKKTSVEKLIIMVLLESGIAYFLFFTAQSILSLQSVNNSIEPHGNLSFATTVFTFQTSAFVGMYPTAIIWLVHANRSYSENTNHPTAGTAPHNTRRMSISSSFSKPINSGAPSQEDTLMTRIDIRKEVAIEMDDMTETPSLGGRVSPSEGDAKPNSKYL